MGTNLVENIFFVLGGIAFLMFGMKVMGSNLEQIAGNNMKKMLGKVTNNRFAGIGVGAAVTALINSSTATTVMLVGFVNIGLMTLVQATAVIMGANIGTTVMAIILALSGASFKMAAYACLIAVIGLVFSIAFKKDKMKKIGNILIGFGLIFAGLEIMSSSINWIKNEYNQQIMDLLSGKHFPLLLVLIGLILTAIMHSSGAMTAVLIALGPAISFQNAAFIILGSNIGTCVTSMVSSIGTNTNAKRTALIHLMFNLIGCLLFIAPIWIWGGTVGDWLETTSLKGNREMQIALFHVVFNISTTLILVWFIKPLVKIATKIIPEKVGANEEKKRLTFIDNRLLETPLIAFANTKKEIVKMSGIAKENLGIATDMLLTGNTDKKELLKENEEALNFLNHSITSFLTKLMAKNLTSKNEKALGSYYHVVSDIERVGDYSENIMEYAERLISDGTGFSEEAKSEIKEVVTTINSLFNSSIEAFENNDESLLSEIDVLEQSIDDAASELENRHIERVKKGECSANLGSIFLQTVSNLERVGDHITNVAYSIKNYRHTDKTL